MSGLVVYPCPLPNQRIAELRLPSDLTRADVKRITAMLHALQPDEDPPVRTGAA
jgi:hypothetical protein